MSQINQYATEALTVKDEDFFDIDKHSPGPNYESQKLKYATLKQQLITDQAFKNLGTDDLTQAAAVRNYGGNSGELYWNELLAMVIDLEPNDSGEGVRIQRNNGLAPVLDRLLFSLEHDTDEHTKFYEDGTAHFEQGAFFVGDGTIAPATLSQQVNPGVLALFSSDERPAVFTDAFLPQAPTTYPQQDSAITWFRSTSKGVLFPNMTEASRDAIPAPNTGLVIFNTDSTKLQVYTGIGLSGWSNLN